MGLQRVHPALVEPLRGEQQMDAEGAAEPADHDEEVHEVAVRGEQFAELVDHDEERRQRVELGAGGPRGLVVEQRAVVAGGAQQLLAAVHLAVQGVAHPVDQGGLVGQVGDHRGGVRQLVQAEEGRAALEVDEDEVERL